MDKNEIVLTIVYHIDPSYLVSQIVITKIARLTTVVKTNFFIIRCLSNKNLFTFHWFIKGFYYNKYCGERNSIIL